MERITRGVRTGLLRSLPYAILALAMPIASLVWEWSNGMKSEAVVFVIRQEWQLWIILFSVTLITFTVYRLLIDVLRAAALAYRMAKPGVGTGA